MSLVKHIGVLGLHTAIGRFLGYLRDTIVIAFLGATGLSDALFISTKIASLFRRLFTEGAFNASFIPIFGSLKAKKGIQKATAFSEQAIMWMLLLIGAITLYVLADTSSFVEIIAAGFKDEPEKLQWTIEFTRIVFPYIVLICITAVVGAVLNAMHNFVQTAASQTVGNLSIIVLFFMFREISQTDAHAAAWAILFSAIVQFVWLYVVAMRLGVVLKPRLPRLTSPLREFMKRLLPGILGAGMVQINVLISIYFGSYLQDGGVSYLQTTERINQFPLSIIGVSLGMVLIPMMTKQLQDSDLEGALKTQNNAIVTSLILAFPISIFVMAVAPLVVSALFMYGRFTQSDVLAAAPCLIAVVSGLPAYVLLKVFSSTFFAIKDTLRPSIVGLLAMGTNAVMCYFVITDVLFVNVPHHVGIAIALSISGYINTIILGGIAYLKGVWLIDKELVANIVRIVVVSIFSAIVIMLVANLFNSFMFEGWFYRIPAFLGSVIFFAAVVYGIDRVYVKKILGVSNV